MSDAKSAHVLIVDDDQALGETLADELRSDGFVTRYVRSGSEAMRLVGEDFDALVTDLRMPEIDGLDLLAKSREVAPERPVIVMTAFSAVDSAIESIRRGAYHYLTKPFKVDELALFLTRALADATSPVLLLGETGTGKGLLAHALHANGRRSARSFVTVNCAALPEALLESELFGHVRGAFSGASANRGGLLVEASGGTLFLDEIGEMPIALQAKLLHVIERGMVRAVGSDKERPVDVRFVTATHRSLYDRVASGQFREDLLFRLNVVTVEIPPLRRRRQDFPALVAHLIEAARAKHPASLVRRVSAAAFDRLLEHPWPGNVRELGNVLERAVVLGRGEEISVEDVAPSLRASTGPTEFSLPVMPLSEINRRYARWAVDQLGGRRVATADKLEIDRKTLARLLGDVGKG